MSAAETRVLKVEGLKKTYGKRTVVDGVAFEVAQGEVVGLLGPNGAGKSTSFHMAAGLVTPPVLYGVLLVGTIGLVTGITGYCPTYVLVGISTVPKKAAGTASGR